jgi:DNA polymerase-3 subunit epsilon
MVEQVRQIVFDTETTGRSAADGDRVVEMGCVELIGLLPTGRTFHCYINPERDVPAEVVAVHGLTETFLRQFPTFPHESICQKFLEFVGPDQLIAHNAEFDRSFLNAELARMGLAPFPQDRFIDTGVLARKRFPGASWKLDALCKRFNISLSTRDKHGALIDAKLLAEVYLELTGGREQSLGFMDQKGRGEAQAEVRPERPRREPRPAALPQFSTPEEVAAHAEFIAKLGAPPVWDKFKSS